MALVAGLCVALGASVGGIVGLLTGKKSVQGNIIDIDQEITNKILDQSSQSCNTQVVNNITGNIVTIDGTTVGKDVNIGNITGTNISGSCIVVSSMDTNLENTLQSLINQEQTSSSGLFGPAGLFGSLDQIDSSTIKNIFSNSVSNVNSQLCNEVSDSTIGGTIVQVSGDNIAGNLNALNISASNINQTCNLSNTISTQIQNSGSTSGTQSQTMKNSFLFDLIILAILVVLGIFLWTKMHGESGDDDGKIVINQQYYGKTSSSSSSSSSIPSSTSSTSSSPSIPSSTSSTSSSSNISYVNPQTTRTVINPDNSVTRSPSLMSKLSSTPTSPSKLPGKPGGEVF